MTLALQLNALLNLTRRRKLYWERNPDSESCSCEYNGSLLIVSKYYENGVAFFVLFGFTPRNATPVRIQHTDNDYELVKTFFDAVINAAVTVTIR